MKQSLFPARAAAALGTAVAGIAVVTITLVSGHHAAIAHQAAQAPTTDNVPLVTGKAITPTGTQAPVGSIPIDLILSHDGKFALVSSMGDRAFVSVISTTDGSVVSRVGFNDRKPDGARGNIGLYYGITLGPLAADGTTPVYVARGSDNLVSVLRLAADGKITDTAQELDAGSAFVAGLACDSTGSRLYVASNTGDSAHDLGSVLKIISSDKGKMIADVTVPGYPYAVAAVTFGANADRKVYVSSEQSGGVSVIDPAAAKVTAEIPTGDHPLALLLNKAQDRLFVANSGSDTVSVVSTGNDKVEKTFLLRPSDARGLPDATPTGLSLSPDEKTLYVTLADLNAVAIVDIASGTVAGYVPVGWYPTAVAVSPDGDRLFVTNAKGVVVRTPNNKPVAVARGEARATYSENVLEGTVSTIDLAKARPGLAALTAQVLANNRIVPNLTQQARTALSNPGIRHVIYIIKENRTYDQVLGDMPQGNGDPAEVLFGKDVTPNLHALAARFALLDNFYCCAEVSGDGWNWSTTGMANPYVIRNVPYSYTGRTSPYDFEGTNNGAAPDLIGKTDVSRPAGGYIWDDAIKKHLTLRNYGFFSDDPKSPRARADTGTSGSQNFPDKKALVGKTDRDYREFDLTYADSDAWVKMNLAAKPRQMPKYGTFASPSRYSEWKREFDGYVAKNEMPQLTLLRMGNDHTAGTTAGGWSPAAMVADNDYGVGEIVDAVSHSPFWKSTAIFVIEDDAQSGTDHVDVHRSISFVISPYIAKATHDSRFYNTDSVLHTMENLLGMDPMNGYDAVAPTLNVFGASPSNDAPYDAILPSRSLLEATNSRRAYRSQDSAKFFPATEADSGPDAEMTDILWHAVKGVGTPVPKAPHSGAAALTGGKAPGKKAGGDGDDD